MTIKHKYLCFLLILFIGFFYFYSDAHAAPPTVILEDITVDTVWSLENSPYLVDDDILILSDATLTIEPGVVVKFDRTRITVFGKVIAEGTETQPIYFTSFYDDEVASFVDDEEFCYEDIDEEGNSLEICEIFDWGDPIARDWDGISFIDSTGSNFKNVYVKYADDALELMSSNISLENINISNSDSGVIAFKNSVVEVTDAVLDNQRDAVVLYDDSSLTIDEISITNALYGLLIYDNASASINDLSLTCAGEGISVYTNSTLNLSQSSITCDHYGLLLFEEARTSVENVKIANAADAGILAFSNLKANSISITESEITDNEYGFIVYDTSIAVKQSKIYGNTNAVLAFSPLDPNQFDFTSNYWGDKSGPFNETSNPNGLGNSVSDLVTFDPFCKNESCISRNPVIIVPGLFGTEIYKHTENGLEKLWLDLLSNFSDPGDQFMDALQFNEDLAPLENLNIGEVIRKVVTFDYSENLITEFENQGYVEDIDLFLFPYDWRHGTRGNNLQELKEKISDILDETRSEKVDIIAHSTGGLLVKKYIVENPASHNIDKAIFVGVPNTGAPKAIKALVVGDDFDVPFLSEKEMKKIAKNLPVAYDLSPSEEYFKNKGSYVRITNQHGFSYTHQDLNFEEIKSFLIDDHGLNTEALSNAHALHTPEFDNYDLRTAGVDLYSINGCKTGTIGRINEVRYNNIFGESISYSRPEQTPGDGTVPLESATNLPINESNKYYALKSSHGSMMTGDGIRQQIVNVISGSELETEDITQDISKCKLKGRAISIFSPLSINVVDQDENHLGLASDGVSIENNIPNASFEIIDEHKFVYLPTDEEQTYTISVTGTGTGTFTITDQTIEDNNVIQTQVFSNISVTPSLLGSISLSNHTDTILSLDTDGNGTTDQSLTPTSVLDSTESQDFIPEQVSNQNNTPSGNTPGVSYGGGYILAAPTEDIILVQAESEPVILPNETVEISVVPLKSNTVKQRNVLAQNMGSEEGKEATFLESQTEGSQENVLTASVADSKAPLGKTTTAVAILGALSILLLAKFFIKL